MAGSELYGDRVQVNHQPAEPALDRFSWMSDPLDGPLTVTRLLLAIEQMKRDNIPADAAVQLGGNVLYAFWIRASDG